MKPLLSTEDLDRTLSRLSHEILEKNTHISSLALVGIRRRGEHLARRIQDKISHILQEKNINERPEFGILDINLYRDDLTLVAEQPIIRETVMPFSIDQKIVVIVDDVLYTGRTVRCALDALRDYGRPKAIQLAVLVDRGHRELPIKADFVGKNIPTGLDDKVEVHLKEIDGDDQVVLSKVSK